MPKVIFSYLLWLVLGMTSLINAAPPAKPTNGRFSYTHIGYPGSNQALTPTTDWRSWSISWTDNALNEEGYFVYVRYGNAGPFTLIGVLPSNSTDVLVSTGKAPVGTEFQARVEVWKYNGKAIEISAALFSTRVPARGSKPDFSPPGNIVAAAVDLDAGAGVNLDDGSLKLSWSDNSESELFYEVRVRDSSEDANPWLNVGKALYSNGGVTQDINFSQRWPHNTTSVVLSTAGSVQINTTTNVVDLLQLIPGKTYQFQIRPTQSLVSNSSWYPPAPTGTNPPAYPTFTVPALKAPGQLNAQVVSENQVLLTWVDNSNNETGFELQIRADREGESPVYKLLATVDSPNVTSIRVPVTQGVPASFKIRAYYEYTPRGASSKTRLDSAYSNEALTGARDFAIPTELVATTSGMDHTIDLTWKDNSSTEYGFDVLARPVGSTAAYRFARAVRSNINSVSVDSLATVVDSVTGRPISSAFEALVKDTAYEFVVRAVGSNEGSVSGLSNVAVATPKHGFTMSRLYHPAQVGQLFSYKVTTLDNPVPTSISVDGLPSGLTFSQSTGFITGTPTQFGLFECPLQAIFPGGVTARVILTLRVLRALGSPQITAPISNRTIGLNTPLQINLAEKFSDSDAEMAVRMETTKGNIDILLYPSLAQQGVANFMAYVKSGAYDNMAFHRLEPGFVLQGGLFKAVSSPKTFSSIAQLVASPKNEPGISNIRGTVAAAKVGGRDSTYVNSNGIEVNRADSSTFGFHGYMGDANSATTNFFINLSGNQDNLDNQNGGFTAFGRLTNTGMAVADAIGALPRGSYTESESLLVDGSLFPVSGIPMDVASAPSSMDISKTVRVTRAYEIQPLSYTISDGAATSVSASIESGSLLKINGIAEGSRSITVTARDLDGNTIAQTFQVTVTPGYNPPAITAQPVSQIVNVGSNVTFKVTASGSALQYQWRRGGTELDGQTAQTLTIEDVQAGNQGEYDVIVSNATSSIVSNRARLSLRTPTDITGITNSDGLPVSSKLVEVGAPLELKALVVGSPEPVFTWKRGSTVIKGQTTNHLKIAAAKLTDGGIYKGSAKNAGGADETPAVNVFVIDKQSKLQVHKPGTVIKLVAGISGPADQITYQWGMLSENGAAFEPLSALSNRYMGVEDPTLTIRVSDLNEDSGNYVCRVSLPDGLGTVSTGIIHVSVANKPILKPMIGFNELPAGFVAFSYQYQVPYETGDAQRPVSFSAKGLPSGLKIDAPSGIIYGVPTKIGNFTIKITAKNPSGTSNEVSGILRISSMQSASTGSFVAVINAAPSLNDNLGGRLDMTVTDTSSFSASVQMGKNTYKTAGRVRFLGQNSDGTINYRGVVTIPRKNKKSLLLIFTVTSRSGDISGVITDGAFDSEGRFSGETGSADINGFRQFWSRSRNPSPKLFTGNLHLALEIPSADVGKIESPQGRGYLKGSSTSSGVMSFSGRLADGASVTSSSIISRVGDMVVFKKLYKNKGSLLGLAEHVIQVSGNSYNINRAAGSLRWYKANTATQDARNYPAGIPATSLAISGNYYAAPGTNKIVMGLPNVVGNAYLDFAEGGLSAEVTNPDVNFRLTTSNKASFTSGENPGSATLSIDPKSGLYTGSFKLQDGRSAAFRGLLIPRMQAVNTTNLVLPVIAAQGAGYFLLPELLPNLKTSKILSGKATLQPTPAVINPQPQDLTIDPDATATFTVGVSGGINDPSAPPITYQWFKNGIPVADVDRPSPETSISGATTNTLTITKAKKENNGSYYCEVSQSVSVVKSQPATLTVREYVANVVLTLQSEPIVNLGDSVIFSVIAEGSAPLTYEWTKDGVVLPDVTGSSYQINSAQVSDSGSYRVKVRNSITPAGGESAPVTLSVITPITSVVITRSPDTEFVAAGSTVVFTATANGSSPTYQWRRNNVNIPNSFGRTLTIPSVADEDGGQYEVYVTNALTPTPVFSAINYLNVATGITNIELIKSYESVGVLPNTNVTYTVTATGDNITYKWFKNSVAIPGEVSNSLSLNSGPTISGETPDVYEVKLYNVVTPLGISGGSFALIVSQPVTEVTITRSPSTPSVVAGSGPVIFTATPNGTGPYTYAWRKNGEILANEQGPTLTISSPTLNDTGSYDCIISNPLHLVNEGITGDANVLTIVPES